jgi:uncharacterized membrane protein
MQKSTTVFSAPLEQLQEKLDDVAAWPSFLPALESVTVTADDRCRFVVRHDGGTREIDVAVQPSPHGTGMIWTVLDGPAWNGHLYLQVVDARRTRVHLVLDVDARHESAAPTGLSGLLRIAGLAERVGRAVRTAA